MNLIEQVARHLEFCGFGTVADSETEGDIFWGHMPDKPDECVCVLSTDSSYAGSTDGARVQIITRGNSTKYPYELSQAIAEELADFEGFLAGDGAGASIKIMNASQGLGADGVRRELYSTNIRVKYCDY
ncbi:MAG: hypothetical protein IKO07_06080 [Clostridia bacterium]|nr:hypothetical protein [Clostridia bacterium]